MSTSTHPYCNCTRSVPYLDGSLKLSCAYCTKEVIVVPNFFGSRQPMGGRQREVWLILRKNGYKSDDIEFLQKQHGWLSVRRIRWKEIDERVLNDITPIYPKAYIDYNRDKEVPRYELILE